MAPQCLFFTRKFMTTFGQKKPPHGAGVFSVSAFTSAVKDQITRVGVKLMLGIGRVRPFWRM